MCSQYPSWENLPIELLRLIALNLDHQDLFTLFQVNRKCSKIATEYFWFKKVQHNYPDFIAMKPNQDTWFDYSDRLHYPIVNYYYIYQIEGDNKIKYCDSLLLYPDYTWRKQIKPLNFEQLFQEYQETRQKQKETRIHMREFLNDQMRTLFSNPVQKQSFLQTININYPNMNGEQQEILNRFCENPDFNILLNNEESISTDNINQTISDDTEKIYIITTKSYELIMLTDINQKFIMPTPRAGKTLYPDSTYLFALSSEIAIYRDLKYILKKLKSDDEIGLSHLKEAIQFSCSEFIEKEDYGHRNAYFRRLTVHLSKI